MISPSVRSRLNNGVFSVLHGFIIERLNNIARRVGRAKIVRDAIRRIAVNRKSAPSDLANNEIARRIMAKIPWILGIRRRAFARPVRSRNADDRHMIYL